MSRLLKILLFAFIFLALTVSPSFAAGSCLAPRPENPAVDLLIKEAQSRGGAAALVPASVIKAVYFIEALPYYAAGSYVCKKNQYTALGLWQIVDGEYHSLVPENEQLDNDETICTDTNCKLSRCNPVDAIEIFSRALLSKIKLWHESKLKPLGKIESIEDIMYSTGRYYGLFVPDQNGQTNNLLEFLPESQRYPAGHPYADTITYPEIVCAKSGYCQTYKDYLDREYLGSTYLNYSGKKSDVPFTFNACGQPQPSPIPVNFTVHPLRPYPYTLVKEETDKKISDSTLTPYCAMRPTAVQFNVHDKRDPTTKIYTIGTLTSNFQSFITPLLSITDPKKPDYTLSYPDKAQRYLADFLEGRAYYEPFTEPASPTLDQQTDLFTRLGVFRKLAPKTYQDKLKRALILRAAGQFNSADNPYGFPPATKQIQNYTVGYWDGANAWSPNDQHGQKITLKDFVNNWAPIPEDSDDPDAYATASAAWQIEANSKWFKLWSYVPMFTREDTKGFIQVLDDTGPPGPQTSDKKEVAVIHPHLARTYEVATSLSYLLSPASTHDAPTPELEEKWYSPAPWDTETPWWMKSYTAGGELGQSVCDFKPAVSLISSSGDLAKDDLITTSVNRLEILAPNPFYEGPPSYDSKCGVDLYPCEKCKYIPGLGYEPDDSNCRVTKDARYDPTYFFTYTPFLSQILTSLTESPRGIFDFFKTASASADKTVDWPGVGNPGEESPVYDFKSSSGQKSLAEAGFHKPGSNQSFLYRYLGTIQCAKEKVLAVLQPFITGNKYIPYSSYCGLGPGKDKGAGGAGLYQIGQATLTCANTSGIFVYQSNPSWSSVTSPTRPDLTNCTIGSCGCGSSSTTMILNSFGSNTDVVTVWNYQHEIGGYVYTNQYCLTNHDGPMQIFDEAGLSVAYIGTGSDEDWNEAETYLKSCGLIYASGTAYWPSGYYGGHVIVITGIIRDTQGKVVAIKTLDPGTSQGDGLTRTIGAGTGDYAFDLSYMWAITH